MTYAVLSLLALLTPLGICVWLAKPTCRFLLPLRFTRNMHHQRHDGLMAAMFLLMLNRAWFSSRRMIFGAKLETFAEWELPYLNAALLWSLVAIGFTALILRGYRGQS